MARKPASNPFVSDRPIDTINYAQSAVAFLAETTDTLHQDSITERAAFGLHLILYGIQSALEEAEEQVIKMTEANGGDHG